MLSKMADETVDRFALVFMSPPSSNNGHIPIRICIIDLQCVWEIIYCKMFRIYLSILKTFVTMVNGLEGGLFQVRAPHF